MMGVCDKSFDKVEICLGDAFDVIRGKSIFD